MPVLLILMLVSGCISGVFDDNVDELKKPASEQSPTPKGEDGVCRASCSACPDWQWGDWSPAPSTVCAGQAFTQQRSATRTCTKVCANLNCAQQEVEEREQQGTKTCNAALPSCTRSCLEACGSWDDANWSSWLPAASTVCQGEIFIKQRSATRSCNNICPDVQCVLYKTEKEEVEGVRDCPDDTIETRDEDNDGDSNSNRVAQQTCAEACQGWKKWSAWSPVGNSTCPAPDALTRPPDLVQARSRSRTCATTNLRVGLQCPTSNHEQMRQACPYCQGKGQVLLHNGTCVSDVQLSDYYVQPGFMRSPFSQLFSTMATRCSHPYTLSGGYSNSHWMLKRTQANYPKYCKEFNKLYDSLPWLAKEKAKFRLTYSVDPFKFIHDEKRIVSLRNKKFAQSWHNFQKLYQWLVSYCAKSNDCLNFLFTPDKFVNLPNAQQKHWHDYQVLNEKLNNSTTMLKPLLIGGRPSYAQDRGVYYQKNTFPATFMAYAQDVRARCRQKWPTYQDMAHLVVCNPGKTGAWPCGAGTNLDCRSLFHRHTDKHGKQIQRRCWLASTPNADLPSEVRFRQCFNQFWGLPEE